MMLFAGRGDLSMLNKRSWWKKHPISIIGLSTAGQLLLLSSKKVQVGDDLFMLMTVFKEADWSDATQHMVMVKFLI